MLTRRLWALLATCAFVLIGARVTVAAPEACPAPSATEARDAAKKAAGWLIANQLADGTFRYQIDSAGNDLGGYSSVRHAGATLALYQVAAATNDDRTLAAADRGDCMDARQPRDERGWRRAHRSRRHRAVGRERVDARGARGATRRRRAAPNTTTPCARSGDFIVSMQRDNGDFYVSYDPTTGQTDRVTLSQYYASEAMWALARLQNALPDDSYRTAALRAARFVSTERNDRDFVPVGPLNDHWAAHAFAEMAAWPIGDAEADYARSLAGRFAALIRWEAQKDSGAPYSWTHGPTRRAAALGTWVEGQAALAHLARTDHRLADLRADTRTERGVRRGPAHRTPARRQRPARRGRVVRLGPEPHGRRATPDHGPARPGRPARTGEPMRGRAAPRGVHLRAARPDRGRDRRRRRSPTGARDADRIRDRGRGWRRGVRRPRAGRRAWPTRSSTGCASPPARPSSRPGSW